MRGIIVAGPLLQFNPTTSAPASSRRRHASGSGIPSWVKLFSREANVITAGTVEIIKNNQVDQYLFSGHQFCVALFSKRYSFVCCLQFSILGGEMVQSSINIGFDYFTDGDSHGRNRMIIVNTSNNPIRGNHHYRSCVRFPSTMI